MQALKVAHDRVMKASTLDEAKQAMADTMKLSPTASQRCNRQPGLLRRAVRTETPRAMAQRWGRCVRG